MSNLFKFPIVEGDLGEGNSMYVVQSLVAAASITADDFAEVSIKDGDILLLTDTLVTGAPYQLVGGVLKGLGGIVPV